jgi:hypothetical protein
MCGEEAMENGRTVVDAHKNVRSHQKYLQTPIVVMEFII